MFISQHIQTAFFLVISEFLRFIFRFASHQKVAHQNDRDVHQNRQDYDRNHVHRIQIVVKGVEQIVSKRLTFPWLQSIQLRSVGKWRDYKIDKMFVLTLISNIKHTLSIFYDVISFTWKHIKLYVHLNGWQLILFDLQALTF